MPAIAVIKDKNMSLREVANALNVPIPSEFLCSITNEVLNIPLMTIGGINFEQDAIISRFEKGIYSCPVTGKPLNVSGVIRNRALEEKIAFWKFMNCLPDLPESRNMSKKNEVFAIVSPTKKRTIKKFRKLAAVTKMVETCS